MEKVARLKAIGESMGKTCAQMAINWIVSQPHLTTALLGVKSEKQMEENTEALGWQLDSKHKEEIDHIFAVN
jgi:aryl-alcohol dehydrogenase-like predicted oxidoreductase